MLKKNNDNNGYKKLKKKNLKKKQIKVAFLKPLLLLGPLRGAPTGYFLKNWPLMWWLCVFLALHGKSFPGTPHVQLIK